MDTRRPQSYRLCSAEEDGHRVFNLALGEYRVGRLPESDITLPMLGVSRNHALLIADRHGLNVIDCGSTNGTYVNDERVDEAEALPGATLRFGSVRLTVEALEPDDAELAIELDSESTARSDNPWSSLETHHERSTGFDITITRQLTTADSPLIFPAGYRRGNSAAATELYRQMKALLKGDIPVLLRGETGVGKERIASILHHSSPRRQAPFLAINCSAIPAELLEAELFGVGKAVATGVDPRPGIFQRANGGTLFLDEIGEMSAALQSKLLRVLQEKEVHPVGGMPRSIDVRILSATNADLACQIEASLFRKDLYFRIAGFSLQVPPLRHCRDDIPGLVEHFLQRFSEEAETRPRGVSIKALRLLQAYPWPGNIRELEHEARRLVFLSGDGQVLDSHQLSAEIRSCDPNAETVPVPLPPEENEDLCLKRRLDAFEASLIQEALRRTDGNQTKAARLLDVSRNGLLKKMKRLEPHLTKNG